MHCLGLVFLQSLLTWKLSMSNDMDQLICDGVVLFHHYHEKQLLFGTLHEPINLLMHNDLGELFFSHKIHNGSQIHRKIRVCNYAHRRCKDLENIIEGRAIGYDRLHNIVYFGGHNGIYKYDYGKKTAHFFAEKNKSIWNIFVQEFFYYVEKKSKRVYINVTGNFQIFPRMEEIDVDNFFVSKHHSMYFSNENGLFKATSPTREIYALSDTMQVSQISQNYYLEKAPVFFAASDGLYIQDTINPQMLNIAEIDHPLGVTFRDLSNPSKKRVAVIYSDYEAIYELTRSIHDRSCMMKLADDRWIKQSLRQPVLDLQVSVTDE